MSALPTTNFNSGKQYTYCISFGDKMSTFRKITFFLDLLSLSSGPHSNQMKNICVIAARKLCLSLASTAAAARAVFSAPSCLSRPQHVSRRSGVD